MYESFQKFVDLVWLQPVWVGSSLLPLWNAFVAFAVAYACVTLLRIFLPKVAAVAETTAYEGVSQPLFWTLAGGGVFLFAVLPFLPSNTFGEDAKMVKESGLQVTMVLSLLLAVLTASTAISDEIEGRTAVTVLSKPISRRDFILGKLVGVSLSTGALFLILGVAFLYCLEFKLAMESRETSAVEFTEPQLILETAQVLPHLLLTFMATVVLTSVCVAISTRLPMLANLLICFAVYLVGNLLPTIVAGTAGRGELLEFIAQLVAVVLPNLDHFNIYTSIAKGSPIPLHYLGLAGLYALLYTVEMTILALLLFEDRDLA